MLGRRLVWGLLRVYQLTLSALVGRTCRFEPSCSHYAQEAVMRFGVVHGGWLAVKRISRCGPFGGHGYDPVPETSAGREQKRSGAASPSQRGGCSCGHHH